MTLDIGTYMLDGGAPYYQTYETRDRKYVAVGAIEGKFYRELLKGVDLDPSTLPPQNDRDAWPDMREQFAEIFRCRTRDEWTALFEGTEACVVPVLELDEVADHPHNRRRGLLTEVDSVLQPIPTPRLSRTPGGIDGPGQVRGADTRKVLEKLGYGPGEIEDLYAKSIVE